MAGGCLMGSKGQRFTRKNRDENVEMYAGNKED